MMNRTDRKPRLKVLCVTPVGPEGMGGVDRLYYYMRQHRAAGAGNDDIDIRFFASRGPVSGFSSLFAFPVRFVAFFWLLLTQRFDVVHINHSTGGSALRKWALVCLAKLFRNRVSTHFHGMVEDAAYRDRPLWLAALRALLRKSDKVVILGEYFSADFQSRLGIPAEKLTIIHNGIPDFAPDLALPKPVVDQRLILFAGEVGPRKGAGLLLEALAMLRQRAPGWHCVMAGNGDIHEYKAMAGMLGLKDLVRFTGWVDADAVHDLMRKADIVVLPSRIEALPLSLIEGTCAGAALVSSTAGASAEVTVHGRNGLIAPLESEAIATALADLVTHPARLAAMQVESRKLFVERFGIARFDKELCQMFRTLAGRAAGSAEPVAAGSLSGRQAGFSPGS
jgi:glycosyltransferase involved in cell wall biosynthesis